MRSVWPKIMTWGYRSLHNGIRALTHSKSVCPTRENTCAHKMGGLWMTKGRRNLGLPHCLGKEKGKALYVGSLFKISWDFFPWGCVTWKRTKSCDLCFQSGKYHDMRIWVVQEWYQSTAPPRKCGPHMHPHVRLYGGGLWRNKRRRNLGVLHCQRKEKNEKGRGLYMLAHYIKCHKLFSHEIVSREEEQNCITCADNIMTWGYRLLHNEKQSWSLTSPGEGKREGLIYGLTIKNLWDPFLQDCVTWGRTKLSNLRGQSGQYHYMRIWVIIEWEAILESYISLERKGRGLYIWVHYLKCHEAFSH